MNANPLDLTLLAAACFLLGIIIGILVTGFKASHKVSQAYESSRKEYEEEKTRLSIEVGEQLARMRGGLKQSVEAYESTLRVLAARLPLNESALLQLDGGAEPKHLPEFTTSPDGPAETVGKSALSIEKTFEKQRQTETPPFRTDAASAGADGAAMDEAVEQTVEQKVPLGEATVPSNVVP